eukprot:CAMPEP_0204919920 /NCGR_PEP_ID=MMETSP1397-20131031/17086_1 /ASSEMBLY_ACC=CAM_ASM_000891 /TAXON_ID=49980 /ORGANISM="Climacostomum Climacostomum virens, Strain Stock W-24" /LENGTH=430 /DNA_ID=CAMNT_0052093555 /DNA_START=334 /DNA_END=1626 /DNA_ORIENTATION=-
MVDRIQSVKADLACTLSKKGISLVKIAQALEVEPNTVLHLIANKTQLDKHTVKLVFNSMELGVSIHEMPPYIPVEALRIFVPETQTGLSRDYKVAIRRFFRKGLPVHQIVDYLGVSETEVLKVLEDDEASVAESQPSTVVAELPVRMPKAPEESKSPAVRREAPKRSEAEERIEPPKRIVEEAPQYIYSYKRGRSSLFRTTVSTGETREEILTNHTFYWGSVWCEVAGGDIYFTGGFQSKQVFRVSGSSLDVTQKAGMLNARAGHGSLYDENYLYAIGGWNPISTRECERLSGSEDRWEALPPLPQACYHVSVVVVKETECLYALGGTKGYQNYLDVIQRLRLGRLEWDVMPLRLPSAAFRIACFSKESKVWFVVGEKLYCLNALAECSITLSKQVGMIESWCGPSYYHSGYLYCSNSKGAAKRLEIGQL